MHIQWQIVYLEFSQIYRWVGVLYTTQWLCHVEIDLTFFYFFFLFYFNVGVPMFMSFKIYHREHHKYLGQDTLDPDLPTRLEAKLFCTTFGKFCWVCLQPLFYAIRPLIVRPMQPTTMEYVNVAVQLAFNTIVTRYCGWHVMFYLVIGTLLTMGFHPIVGL